MGGSTNLNRLILHSEIYHHNGQVGLYVLGLTLKVDIHLMRETENIGNKLAVTDS